MYATKSIRTEDHEKSVGVVTRGDLRVQARLARPRRGGMGKRVKESFGALGRLEEKGGGLLDGSPSQHSTRRDGMQCVCVSESECEKCKRNGRADGQNQC